MYINWSNWIIFVHDRICYTEIGGNKNHPDSLKLMVNYHYHGENRVITWQLTSIPLGPTIKANNYSQT